jgi:2-methylcitrate dehydratase PrpD
VGLSATLARHCCSSPYETIPAAATEAAKRSLLDAIGVSFAASTLAPECRPFIEVARDQGAGPCTILGVGGGVAPLAAVLANGALAHALDFEDAHDEALVHPNAPLVPVLLALAESEPPADGRRFLAAMAVGCDLTCRLSLACGGALLDRGWYPPSLVAAFGATAGAAHLLGLDERQVLDSFSLLLGQLGTHGELINAHGSVMRSVRDAFPAQAALASVLLARRGVRGYDAPFEGRAGFFRVYAGGDVDEQALLAGLGETYAGTEISFKPWPSCRGTHAFVEGALALRREHELAPADVERLELTGDPVTGSIVAEPRAHKLAPGSVIEAKFSVYYTVSLALELGAVTLGSFDEGRLTDEDVLALARRVHFEADGSRAPGSGIVTAVRGDGSRVEVTVESALGSPRSPLGDEALIEKFSDCVSHAASPVEPADALRLAEDVLRLEQSEDVGALTARAG